MEQCPSALPGVLGGTSLFDCWDRGTVEQCPSALPEVLGGTSLFDCWDRGTVEQCPSALLKCLEGLPTRKAVHRTEEVVSGRLLDTFCHKHR